MYNKELVNLLIAVVFVASTCGLDIYMRNNCSKTLWPAITGVNLTSKRPVNIPTPPKLSKNESCGITVPEPWAGRVWAKSGCNDTGCSCVVGDCGQPNCNGLSSRNTTLAEMAVQNHSIFYDISLGKAGPNRLTNMFGRTDYDS